MARYVISPAPGFLILSFNVRALGSLQVLVAFLCAWSFTPPAWAADTPQITVGSLELVGVKQVEEAQLRSVLATRASSWLPWVQRETFSRAAFEADLQRIHAFYVERGFPDARVTSFDVNLNREGDRVDLVIHVSEGEPIRVTAIRFEGFTDVPPDAIESLSRRIALRQGRPLDRSALATSREAAANVLRDQGYPYPRVEVEVARETGGDPKRAGVVFRAEPGAKAVFGETTVEGVEEVSDAVVLRTLLFKPGELYRRSVIQETQRKLYGLELFEFVNVAPVRQPDPDDEEGPASSRPQAPPSVPPAARAQVAAGQAHVVPMKVTVTESNHRRVRFSVGYGTEEKARGEVEYRQLNFLGGARSGTVHGKWSSLERGVRLRLQEPYLFAPRWSASLDTQRWDSHEPAFNSVTSGGNLSVAYQPGTRNTFSITGTTLYQSSRITRAALEDLSLRDELIALGLDPRDGGQDGMLNALSFDAQRSTANNPLDATAGYTVSLHLERALTWLSGDYPYSSISADVRHYLKLGPVVLATKGRAGSIAPAEGLGANVPFAKRYFLGGSSSLRGWGRYEVSPLSGSGLPLGGFSMFEGTVELRGRLFGQLGAVAFLDAGNVWADEWRLDLSDLRYSVGPGLRYQTPIGPIRMDLGYQLNPIEGLLIDGKPEKRRWRVHFSIGQAF